MEAEDPYALKYVTLLLFKKYWFLEALKINSIKENHGKFVKKLSNLH